jgi:hypothetical protein
MLFKTAIVKTNRQNAYGQLTNTQLLALTFVLAAISYIWAGVSDGFYQGEEGAQYINMLDFWTNWKVILGNWAKTGWKLVYVVPALLGQPAVLALNCLLSAFTGFFVYKVCVLKGVKLPLLGIVMLFSQVLWFQLSHRTYSEILTAFLLILSIYFYCRGKLVVTALLFSYILIIRQEFYPLAFIFGLFLLWKRKFLPAVLLAVFPVLYNIAGYFATNDILFLWNNSKKLADYTKDAYPRQGFDHYFRVSPAIFGIIPLACFVAYLALLLFKKIKPDYLLLACAGIYFMTHCILNWQSVVIGASTGGNWRYMIIISPVMAVLAASAFDKVLTLEKKWFLLVLLVPWFFLILKYASFRHNWVMYDTQHHDRAVMIYSLLVVLLLVIPAPARTTYYLLLIMAGGFMLKMIRPIKLMGENVAMKEVYKWSKENKIDEHRHILCSLPLYNYFYDKRNDQFAKGKEDLNETTLKNAPVGTYVFWDTHYATKYGNVPKEAFTTDKYKLIKTWTDVERSIAIALVEKISL